MLKRFTFGALLVALALAAPAAGPLASAGAAEPAPTAATPVIPSDFELAASNGYRATVIAGAGPTDGVGGVLLELQRRDGKVFSSATYGARAEVTETTIKASFGPLGEIDVHAVPSGGTATERSQCGGKPVTFGQGRWEGTIRFRGEGGYTAIDATGAKAAGSPLLSLVCAAEGSEGIGGHSPGALLGVGRRHGTQAVELSVRKNKRSGPTRILAAILERHDGLTVQRAVSMTDASKAFDFEIPPGNATVTPAAPFSGSLTVARHKPHGPLSVAGNLKVDLPGRPAFPLLGPGTVHASLVRAVLNPSHPF